MPLGYLGFKDDVERLIPFPLKELGVPGPPFSGTPTVRRERR
jgi:hypothetical protein